MSALPGSPSALKRTCYGGHWLYVMVGFLLGSVFGMALVFYATDVDTPVALEPKCETIIIHRDWR